MSTPPSAFVESSEIAPQPYAPTGATRKVLPIRASDHPEYRLRFHPMRWQYHYDTETGKGEWLPSLSRIRIEAGIDNIDKGGRIAPSNALAAEEGWITLDPEVVPGEPYMVRYVAYGGDAYVPRWVRYQSFGGRALSTSDDAAARDWLRKLVKTGAIPGPDPIVVRMLKSRIEAEYQRDAGAANVDPKAKLRADEAKPRIDAMNGPAVKRPAREAAAHA